MNLYNKDIASKNLELRIACDLGEVDFFIDMNRNRNCYGTGINEVTRILQYGNRRVKEIFKEETTEGTIFLGASVHDQALKLSSHLSAVHTKDKITIDDLGDVKDKHEMTRRIWWMRGISKYIAIPFHSVEELVKASKS